LRSFCDVGKSIEGILASFLLIRILPRHILMGVATIQEPLPIFRSDNAD